MDRVVYEGEWMDENDDIYRKKKRKKRYKMSGS